MEKGKVRSFSVIVVDDDVIVRIAIADDLRDAGFSVVEARDGREALSLLESGLHADAVFSDVNMPGPMSGLSLVEHLSHRFGQTRILLTSGSRDAAREAARLGIPFVRKPYLPSEIVDALDTLLADKEASPHERPIQGNGNAHGGGR